MIAETTLPSELPIPVVLGTGVPESSYFRVEAIEAVLAERDSQDRQWGVSRNLHPQLWMPVIAEELGEANKAILKGDRANYRQELIQTAAVALAALQDWLWQERFRDLLPPPQVEAFAWERATPAPRLSPGATVRDDTGTVSHYGEVIQADADPAYCWVAFRTAVPSCPRVERAAVAGLEVVG